MILYVFDLGHIANSVFDADDDGIFERRDRQLFGETESPQEQKEADSQAGRKTLPIVMGKRRAGIFYSTLTAAVYLWIIGWVAAGQMPIFSLIALLTLPFAVKAIQGTLKHKEIAQLMPAMMNNVLVVLLTQLLLGIGYILAGVIG